MRGAAIVVVVSLAVACSDTIDALPADAGARDAGPADLGDPYLFELDDVVEPLPPASVVLTPCPSGWREVEGPSFTRCEPWPEEGRQQCADDAAHFPGGPGCALIGATCPLGQYAEQLAAPVLYVRASTAAPSGDGTIANPFTRIASALAVALSGTTIALSKGVFDEALELPAGVTVRGACVAETRLTLSNAPVDAVLVTVRAPAALENLTLDARAIGVHVTGAGAELTASDLAIIGARTAAVLADQGGVAMLSSLALRRTDGRGLRVRSGARIDAETVVIDANQEVSASAAGGGSVLKVDNAAISGTRLDATGYTGVGLFVLEGATIELSRSVVEDSGEFAAGAYDPDTRLVLRDVVIRRTRGTMNGEFGIGIGLVQGASAVLERVVLSEQRNAGVSIADGSSADLLDVAIEDTREIAANDREGDGIAVRASRLRAERVRIDTCRRFGVLLGDATAAELLDLQIARVQVEASDQTDGLGLATSTGATFSLSRASIEDAEGGGLVISGAGVLADVEDLFVRGSAIARGLTVQEAASATVTRARLEGDGAVAVLTHDRGTSLSLSESTILGANRALAAQSGSYVRGERLRIANVRLGAANADGVGTILELEDVRVSSTEGDALGLGGRGLDATRGAFVSGRKMIFEKTREAAAFASEPGTRMELTDVIFAQTLARACAITTCSESPGGLGISVRNGARLSMERFRATDNALYGVQVDEGGEVDQERGYIARNVAGVNVIPQNYQIDRLIGDVLFVDNTQNIASFVAFVVGAELPAIEK